MTYRECFTESGKSGRRIVLKRLSLNQAELYSVVFVLMGRNK